MERTARDLEIAAARSGARLVSTHRTVLADGSSTIGGRFAFQDPWCAARLLDILAEQDAADPVVATWARAMVEAARAELGDDAEPDDVRDVFAATVHANVQRQIAFVPEVGEQFQSARTTMVQGYGDCDCHARLVHALARSQGLGSTLRFFEHDGEPTHVAAALATTYGPAWAETTIDARFGEHPQAAYRRLGLEGAGARADLGFLGLEFVTAGNVRDRKNELDGYVRALAADVKRCAGAIDAPTVGAWDAFAASWRMFMQDDPSWYDAGGQGRQAADFASAIREWQAKLAALCTLSAPTLPTPPSDEVVGFLSTLAVLVAVAGAAGVAVALARR